MSILSYIFFQFTRSPSVGLVFAANFTYYGLSSVDFLINQKMEYEDTETHCIPFIIKNLLLHRLKYSSSGRAAPPLFVGVNGMQGVGKTTLVSLFTSRSQFIAPHASVLFQ